MWRAICTARMPLRHQAPTDSRSVRATGAGAGAQVSTRRTRWPARIGARWATTHRFDALGRSRACVRTKGRRRSNGSKVAHRAYAGRRCWRPLAHDRNQEAGWRDLAPLFPSRHRDRGWCAHRPRPRGADRRSWRPRMWPMRRSRPSAWTSSPTASLAGLGVSTASCERPAPRVNDSPRERRFSYRPHPSSVRSPVATRSRHGAKSVFASNAPISSAFTSRAVRHIGLVRARPRHGLTRP